MDRPRRRTAGRPAGPPDAVPPSAARSGPLPAATAAVDAGSAPPDVMEIASPIVAADAPQHRRRQRAPRGTAAEPAGESGESAGASAVQGDREALALSDRGASVQGDREASVPAGRRRTRDLPPSAARTADAGRVPAAPEHPERRRGDGRDDRRRGESAMERSLRALVSTRTTQLPFDVAMRAREVAQPSTQELADAERDLVLVRRHYVPPAPLVTKKGDAPGRSGSVRTEETAARGEGRRGGRRSGRG